MPAATRRRTWNRSNRPNWFVLRLRDVISDSLRSTSSQVLNLRGGKRTLKDKGGGGGGKKSKQTHSHKATKTEVDQEAKSGHVRTLCELCMEVVLHKVGDESVMQSAKALLPLELKAQLFDKYSAALVAEETCLGKSRQPFIGNSAECSKDVQQVNIIACQRVIPLCFQIWNSLDYSIDNVRRLVEEEAADVNESDQEGFCPLHYAAIYGRVDACRLLLQKGADPRRQNSLQRTPGDLTRDSRVRRMLAAHEALFTQTELRLIQEELAARREALERLRRRHTQEKFSLDSIALEKKISLLQCRVFHGL